MSSLGKFKSVYDEAEESLVEERRRLAYSLKTPRHDPAKPNSPGLTPADVKEHETRKNIQTNQGVIYSRQQEIIYTGSLAVNPVPQLTIKFPRKLAAMTWNEGNCQVVPGP